MLPLWLPEPQRESLLLQVLGGPLRGEPFRVEERKMKKEEIVEKVVRKLIELVPDLLERAPVESGAMAEIPLLAEGHQDGAGEGI